MTLSHPNKMEAYDVSTPRAEVVRLAKGLFRWEVHRGYGNGVFIPEREVSVHLTYRGAVRSARRFVRRVDVPRTVVDVIEPPRAEGGR